MSEGFLRMMFYKGKAHAFIELLCHYTEMIESYPFTDMLEDDIEYRTLKEFEGKIEEMIEIAKKEVTREDD